MFESVSLRLGIIPARAASTRFPNKPLAKIQGKPMIQHVWEAARRSRLLTDLLVATDDAAIAEAVRAFGGKAVLTGRCESGTDRVASVARERREPVIINLQGDEPLLDPESIDRLIEALEGDSRCGMATLAVKRRDPEALRDPNVVKVAFTAVGEALYFSRQPLVSDADGSFFKHIGIYAFRREVLLGFCDWAPSKLERAERLEQLRALENGVRMRVVEVSRDCIAVDTPEDITRVERVLDERISV